MSSERRDSALRLGVYTDYVYRRDGGHVYGERAFVLFVAALRAHVRALTILGRLDPAPGSWHYRVPEDVRFEALPYYERLSDPVDVGRALGGMLGRFWRALDGLDVVWLLGPHPTAVVFAILARLRGKRVVLGVRQDLPTYVRRRHPGRRWAHRIGDALEGVWRLLARGFPVVVVGPDLAANYASARAVLPIAVSLVGADELVAPADALARWDEPGERRIVSVGRLDAEKNPLLLADILAELRRHGGDWRLIVCGDGPLRGDVEARLKERGVEAWADVLGYVNQGDDLRAVYRSAHAFLHVSWTEGLPQVLFEAFAAGLPVVATAVGGVAEAAGDAALLVPPGDAGPPAAHLERIAADATVRDRLVRAGLDRVRERTMEAEVERTAAFLLGGAARSGQGP